MSAGADTEVLDAALARFAGDAAAALSRVDGPDGDVGAVPSLLEAASGMGMYTSPDPSQDGFTTGVWGRHVHTDGPSTSIAALAGVAGACAGLAVCVHAQGLGCLALDGAPSAGGDVVAAAFAPLGAEAESGVLYEAGRLDGSVEFVVSARDADTYAVFARDDAGTPHVMAVPPGAPGVRVQPVGDRVGLRAATVAHVSFLQTPVPDSAVVAAGAAAERVHAAVAAADLLGTAAIAAGTARGAVAAAAGYAGQRHQGGTTIDRHPAVRILLAEAEASRAVCDAMLAAVDRLELRRAVLTRLACAEHAVRAVTACLQVMGGYGYMDDYGISKRLRDVTALAVHHGGADRLRLVLRSAP